MAGIKGRSGPPGNQNAFQHGLASIQERRANGITTEREESIKTEILDGLVLDKGGEEQISTAMRILAEVIASDAAWLMVFNSAIEAVIANNPRARQNPRGLAQLDGYKRPLVNSLTGNIQKFGLEKVNKIRTLEEIFAEPDENGGDSNQNTFPPAETGTDGATLKVEVKF